jgi:hypothetical protein
MELGSLVSALRAPIHDARSSLFSTQLVRPGRLSHPAPPCQTSPRQTPERAPRVSRADATNHPGAKVPFDPPIEAGAELLRNRARDSCPWVRSLVHSPQSYSERAVRKRTNALQQFVVATDTHATG